MDAVVSIPNLDSTPPLPSQTMIAASPTISGRIGAISGPSPTAGRPSCSAATVALMSAADPSRFDSSSINARASPSDSPCTSVASTAMCCASNPGCRRLFESIPASAAIRPTALDRCIDKLADPVPQLVHAACRIIDNDQRGLVPGPFRNVLMGPKSIEFPLLHKPGKPSLLGRLADEFQGKPRLAAPGSAGQNADRNVPVASDPVLQVFDCVIAPKQGHHVSPVGTQQRRIRII